MQDLVQHVPPCAPLVAGAFHFAGELEQIQHVAVFLVHLGIADDSRMAAENVRQQRAVRAHMTDYEQISGGAQVTVRSVKPGKDLQRGA